MPDSMTEALQQELATQAQMERTEQYVEAAMAVNLDEVTDDTVTVTIKEYRTDPETHRRVATSRKVVLDSFVPMKIFNKMMAGRQKMLRLQKLRQQATDNGGEVNEDDPQFTWIMQSVLNVWNQTEPEMTMERLEDGLNFAFINKLFTIFFGDLMITSRKGSKAASAGNTLIDSVSSQGQ